MLQKSRTLFYASLCTLACGGVIIGLAAWNANEVAWSPLTNAIAAVGGVLIGVSLLGAMNSQGCTFCCHMALYLYLFAMGALSLAGIAFVITAGIKQSDWVEDLARRYTDDESEENIDHLKDKYDEFMPFVIAFGCITVFSCIIGFLAARSYLKSLGRETTVRTNLISERRDKRLKAEREKVKQRHRETIVQMTEKYKIRRDPEGTLLQS